MVYVISIDEKPLMPTKRHGKVRRLLRDKKAKVIRREPFTIKLLYRPETNVVQDCTLGLKEVLHIQDLKDFKKEENTIKVVIIY